MTTENGLTAVNGTSQDRLHPIKPVIAPTPLAGLDPLAGQLGHLTSDQEKAFASFKSLVSAEGLYQSTPTPSHEDGTLLRFLRARKFDPQEALKQFSEMEKWRKETGTLGIQAFYDAYDINEFEEAKKVFTMWTGRRVRTGQPFYVLKVKDLDNKVSFFSSGRQALKMVSYHNLLTQA